MEYEVFPVVVPSGHQSVCQSGESWKAVRKLLGVCERWLQGSQESIVMIHFLKKGSLKWKWYCTTVSTQFNYVFMEVSAKTKLFIVFRNFSCDS